jgi:hydrogenase maturation protease
LSERAKKVLLIGYGNPGRSDDGLGPAVAEAVEKLNISGVTVDANYQLSVEDAEAVANHQVVIFADADSSGPEPFSFRAIEPRAYLSFSSHSIDPAAVLALAGDLFGAKPEGYLFGIRGYEFDEMREALTEKARANMEQAVDFLKSLIAKGSFRRMARDFNRTIALHEKEEI